MLGGRRLQKQHSVGQQHVVTFRTVRPRPSLPPVAGRMRDAGQVIIFHGGSTRVVSNGGAAL